MEKFLANSLSVECPELTKDWHPTLNLPLTAESVSFGSNRRVWWKCHKCGHEWQTYIHLRRRQRTSCPNCIGRVQKLENSFAAAHPELIEEWHPTKNLPYTPYNVPMSGTRRFWWVCPTCEHEWETSLCTRSNGSGCPLCGKFKNRQPYCDHDIWAKEIRKLVIKPKYIHHGK